MEGTNIGCRCRACAFSCVNSLEDLFSHPNVSFSYPNVSFSHPNISFKLQWFQFDEVAVSRYPLNAKFDFCYACQCTSALVNMLLNPTWFDEVHTFMIHAHRCDKGGGPFSCHPRWCCSWWASQVYSPEFFWINQRFAFLRFLRKVIKQVVKRLLLR